MNRHSTLVWSLLLLCPLIAKAQNSAPFPDPSKDISSTTILATKHEPGERLLIRGTVYYADGASPYAGLVIYLYQTDASGVYNNKNRSWREPRLHGWVKTGANGEYEIQTIKPGSYPGSRNPAHIHAVIKLPGKSPMWIDDFLFEGDPFLTDQLKHTAKASGKFSNILNLRHAGDSSLVGTRDIRIEE